MIIGNKIQYPVINHNGKEFEKEYILHTHTHIYITGSLCCDPTQYCESNTLQLKN